VKNDFCKLPEETIQQLPDRYRGLLLSRFVQQHGFVLVPADTFGEMVDIITESAQEHALAIAGQEEATAEVGYADFYRLLKAGTIMKLTDAELGTVLAALRQWQRLPQIDRDNDPIANSEGAVRDVLSAEDIDRLCERLNTEVAADVRREVFAAFDMNTGELYAHGSAAVPVALDGFPTTEQILQQKFEDFVNNATAGGAVFVGRLSCEQVERLVESARQAEIDEEEDLTL
jgi:enamine deaminase RidA (YjgF/YER057c/UK114 family)